MLIYIGKKLVGTAGFEPATTTPPALWVAFPYKSMTY